MYQCPECKKNIEFCPNCKQPVRDNLAALLYQISGALLLVALIFFALEVKIKEEIEVAMRPFKVAEDIAAKKSKVKAADLPKAPKKEKEVKEVKEKPKDDKKEEKKEDVQGKDADFRAGRWGVSRKRIEEEEKAERLDRANPYSLEYIAKVGNYQAIARYEFSSNRLKGGNYLVFGQRVKDIDELRNDAPAIVGEPCITSIKNEYSIYRMPRNMALSEIANIDQFFYEMYISMASQYGIPVVSSLSGLEDSMSRREKVTSVIVFDRMIHYEWETKRSKISFTFAAYEGIPYFYIAYHDLKEVQ